MNTNPPLPSRSSQAGHKNRPVPSDWTDYLSLHAWLVGRLEMSGCQQQDAEDVAQETLHRAQLSGHLGEDLESRRGWLLVVGRNLVRDRVRRQTRIVREQLRTEHLDAHDPSASLVGECGPETQREGSLALLTKIFDAYSGLRDRDRDMLAAWCLTGGDTRVVATALGMPQRAVKVCVFRAR